MIVLDVETTGLNERIHSIIDIGAVDVHNPTNQFSMQCQIIPKKEFSKESLDINKRSIESLTDSALPTMEKTLFKFFDWAKDIKQRTLIGQNISLVDYKFLEVAAEHFDATSLFISLFGYRTIDLHTLVCTHYIKRNVPLPQKNGLSAVNSSVIMEYVGIPEEPRPHKAINGAVWEAEAFSRLIKGKPLFPYFEKYSIPEYLRKNE